MSSILSSALTSTAQAAHAAAASLLSAKQIAVGASVPEAAQGKKVKIAGAADKAVEISEKLAQGSGKVVLVGFKVYLSDLVDSTLRMCFVRIVLKLGFR